MNIKKGEKKKEGRKKTGRKEITSILISERGAYASR